MSKLKEWTIVKKKWPDPETGEKYEIQLLKGEQHLGYFYDYGFKTVNDQVIKDGIACYRKYENNVDPFIYPEDDLNTWIYAVGLRLDNII